MTVQTEQRERARRGRLFAGRLKKEKDDGREHGEGLKGQGRANVDKRENKNAM
jgi:hypothetical protein